MSVSSKMSVEAAEDLGVQLRLKTEDAYQVYRQVRWSDDHAAAEVAWVKYGMIEDAAIRFETALESVKAVLDTEI